MRMLAFGACLAAGAALAVGAAQAAGAPRPAPAAAAAGGASKATPAVPDSRHYLTTELDVPPGIKVRVQPLYPARAARENVSGKAIVKLFIDADGAVERVEVERAAPAGYGFDQSAANAFSRARFSPAMKDGKRVRAQMRIEVSFDAPTTKPQPQKTRAR